MKHYNRLLLYLLSALAVSILASGCGDDESEDNNGMQMEECASGAGVVIDGYCVLESAITEEGFSCPPMFSRPFAFGRVGICGPGGGGPGGPGMGFPPQDVLDDIEDQYPDRAPTDACTGIVCDGVDPCVDGMCPMDDPFAACRECDPMCPSSAELFRCGESGTNYCNQCLLECYEDTPAEQLTCRVDEDMDACLDACPTSCDEPERCASDGQTYCTTCEIGCRGLAVANPSNCE